MKKSRFFRRAQALVLAVLMLVSVFGPCATALTVPAGSLGSMHEGEIVANNYDLSDAEKALLKSGLLVGNIVSYSAPDASDSLIEVDADLKEITVKDYTDKKGNVWKPVAVNIVVGNEVKETVAITSGKGTYTYTGNAFSVKAEYALDVEVPADRQQLLLNAPEYLYDGLKNIDIIAAAYDGILEEAMPTFKQLADTGIKVEYEESTLTFRFNTEKSKAAVAAFDEQMAKNDGVIDLTAMLQAYAASGNKTQYLLENGAALKEVANQTQQHIANILKVTWWGWLDGIDNADAKLLLKVRDNLKNTANTIESVAQTSWAALDNVIVKEDISELEYAVLDLLVQDLETFTNIPDEQIKNPLRVATAQVQYNMSMFDVNVKVVLNLTDPDSKEVKYYAFGEQTATVTLAENATKAEIIEAVAAAGIEQNAETAWGENYVDGKFTATKSELPAKLTDNIDYIITYNPNIYNIVFDFENYGDAVEYPYGYVLELENHADEKQAYDYTIGGVYYPQGSEYVIVDEVKITRVVGKSYNKSDLYTIVADQYLTGVGYDILTSGALKGNEEVAVREPDNANNIVTLSGNELTALDYSASYNGLYWKPYSYTLSNGNTYFFKGVNQVTIPDNDFEKVTVTYRLKLENFDADEILAIANLADVLNAEAQDQLDALELIVGQKGNLETLNRSMVNILASLIADTTLNSDSAKDAALKECFNDALAAIKDNHMGVTNLYLFDIVNEYSQATDGLLYYYNNNDKIRKEIGEMAAVMTKMLGEDGALSAQDKLDALATLMRTLPSNVVPQDKVDEYVDKLSSLETTMNRVKDNLSAPNSAIDVSNKNIGKLTAALKANGTTESFDELEALYLEDSSIFVVASNKVALSVTLNIQGGKNTTIASDLIFTDAIVDATFVNNLKAAIKAELDTQGVGKYHTTTYSDDAFDALIGIEAGDIPVRDRAYTFIWTYKDFAVSVPGTEVQYVNYSDRVINLPESGNAEYRYDYFVNGTKVSSGNYTLTQAELDNAVNGTLNITKNEVYVLEENLIKYVNGLNDAIGSDQAVFALVEDANGKYSLVLKVDASAPNGLMAAVQSMAIGMVQGSYPYVGIEDSVFLADGSVHLQAVIDALLNSGFGTQTMLNVVDANGNIVNMSGVNGTVVTNKAMNKFGGKLLETTMQLGTNEADATNLPFYITLGNVSSEFVAIRNLLDSDFSSLVDFSCYDGALTVSLDMPEKVYEAFLAVLIITGNIDISEINDVDGEITASFINNIIKPVFEDGTSVETFDNTFEKLGADLKLSSYKGVDSLFNAIKNFYNDSEYTYDKTSGIAHGNISISKVIDAMNIGVLGNVIAEKDTGLDVAIRINLKDLGNKYEALYVDTDAAGLTNKIGLAKDVKDLVDNIAGTAYVSLLSDVEADLTFNTVTLFDLNGFTVNGNVAANRKTIVINSNLDSTMNAGINGDLSGNLTLTAGKYTDDVAAFVKNGFEQNANGEVSNIFYNMYKDANGDIVIDINLDLLNTREMPDITALAVDIACEFLFNGYANNYLELDGNKIYDISMYDLVGLYAASDRVDTIINDVMNFVDGAQLSAFVNTVLDDLFDFAAISEAIANNTPVFEYAITTKTWNVEFDHVEDGDYITANVTSGATTNDGNVKICLVGDTGRDYFVDLFAELGETVTADINVGLLIDKEGKTFKFTAGVDANVLVDLSDPDYAVMFCVIAADGLSGDASTKLVSAIKEYYQTGEIDALSVAFNSLTTAQLIDAIKAVGKDDTFVGMVNALGLKDVVDEDVIELESLFDKMGKVAAFILRKSEIEGGSRKLGTYADSDKTYGVSKAGVEKAFNRNLFRGYDIEANIYLADSSVKIKLFDDIVVEDIDYSRLIELIEKAEALNADDYTAESWADLETALVIAKQALSATDQLVVNEAADALEAAIEALVEKTAEPEIDYARLENLIAQAEALNADDYTAESWADLETALVIAKQALNATEQSVVDSAADALEAAINALVEKQPVEPEVNYDRLNALIAEAQGLNADDYTAESWADLEAALADAIAALESDDQAVVDAAADALEAAINALVEKQPVEPEVNYDRLNALIAEAQGLNADDYTAESWADLEAALADAIAALESDDQAVVDAAADALEAAIDALALKAPEFVDDHGALEIGESDKLAGSVVDYQNQTVYLDTHYNGITVAEIKELFKFYALNADTIEIVVGDGLADNALVANGTKVKAIAKRNGTPDAVVTYTIIVIGDINANGRVDVGDASLITKLLVGYTQFSELEQAAADTNNNGRIDVGDAARIASKIVYWQDYETLLGTAI